MANNWITVGDVQSALGLAPYDTYDEEWVAACADASAAWLARVRPELSMADPLPADLALGLKMLASRWYRRRNNDSNASFQEFGAPAPSIDRDIEHILGVGRAQGPVIA